EVDVEDDAVEGGDVVGRELDPVDRADLAAVIGLLAEVDLVFGEFVRAGLIHVDRTRCGFSGWDRSGGDGGEIADAEPAPRLEADGLDARLRERPFFSREGCGLEEAALALGEA